MLGAEHEGTLRLATNLALSLSRCGLKMEAEQLLRDTLALSRRTLGPSDEETPFVLQSMRSIGLTSR